MTKTYIRNWNRTMTPDEATLFAMNKGFNVYAIKRDGGKVILYFTCGSETGKGETVELITDNGRGNRPSGNGRIYELNGSLTPKKYSCYGAC